MSAGAGGGGERSSPAPKPSKFAVYQNPAFSAALTTSSLRPSKSTFVSIFIISIASVSTLLRSFSRYFYLLALCIVNFRVLMVKNHNPSAPDFSSFVFELS